MKIMSIVGAGIPFPGFLFLGCSIGLAPAANVDVVSSETPWRVFLTLTPTITQVDGKPAATSSNREEEAVPPPPPPASPLPPVDWMEPQFDDSGWGRYREDLFEMIGGYALYEIEGEKVLHPDGWNEYRIKLGIQSGDESHALHIPVSPVPKCRQ